MPTCRSSLQECRQTQGLRFIWGTWELVWSKAALLENPMQKCGGLLLSYYSIIASSGWYRQTHNVHIHVQHVPMCLHGSMSTCTSCVNTLPWLWFTFQAFLKHLAYSYYGSSVQFSVDLFHVYSLIHHTMPPLARYPLQGTIIHRCLIRLQQ